MISSCSDDQLPTTKQWRGDQLSALRGRGLHAETMDLRRGGRNLLELRLPASPDFQNGFASLVQFFPEGKALVARLEKELWRWVLGGGKATAPTPIIYDQYLCSGGQIHALLAGRVGGVWQRDPCGTGTPSLEEAVRGVAGRDLKAPGWRARSEGVGCAPSLGEG